VLSPRRAEPRRIGPVAEYDALPGLGHCGHNIIAASAVGAIIAASAVGAAWVTMPCTRLLGGSCWRSRPRTDSFPACAPVKAMVAGFEEATGPAFEPVIAHLLLQGITWMSQALDVLARLCVQGIEVDRDRLVATTGRSVGVVTALTPYLGYAVAADIAKAAVAGAGDVRDLVLATGAVQPAVLDELLQPERLAGVTNLGEVLPGDPVTVAAAMTCGARH